MPDRIPLAEWLYLWSAFACYTVAGAAALVSLGREAAAERKVLGCLAFGLLLHAIAIGLRWQRLGNGPFLTMFEILASNVWSLTAIFALAYWRVRAVRPAAAVVMPVLFVMMAWTLSSDPQAGHLPATYRTLWLYVHVAFGKIFLGAVLVAVGISGIVLLRGTRAPRLAFARLAADEKLEVLAFRFMVVGFVFESLMLVAGAIWAQDAWGRYWAWDPLETWAFVTWVAIAGYLHARVAYRVRPSVSAALVIGVFVIAFLTFFGVPFLSTAPHKGAI